MISGGSRRLGLDRPYRDPGSASRANEEARPARGAPLHRSEVTGQPASGVATASHVVRPSLFCSASRLTLVSQMFAATPIGARIVMSPIWTFTSELPALF